MNENDFEAELLADGYTEIAIQRFEPQPDKGEHGHTYAIRGLALHGSFTVTQDNQSTTYRPGQVLQLLMDIRMTSGSVQKALAYSLAASMQ